MFFAYNFLPEATFIIIGVLVIFIQSFKNTPLYTIKQMMKVLKVSFRRTESPSLEGWIYNKYSLKI